MIELHDKTLIDLPYLRSIQSRTRSHLMYSAKKMVSRLYGFDQNCSLEYIRERITWLLMKDRFTCALKKREVYTQ